MTTSISTLMAHEHVLDLQHEAERWRTSQSVRASDPEPEASAAYGLRLAHPDEAPVLRSLAALDSQPDLEGEVLLALLDGKPVAALSLSDRRVVATPFLPTNQAVALLHLRAQQLLGPRRQRRGWRTRLLPHAA
jgi:hypothetical protein